MREHLIFVVTGGRDFSDRDLAYRKLNKFHKKYGFTHLVSGGAPGLDTFADEWCDTVKGVQSVVCRAHWERDKRAAGPIRNSMMAMLRPQVLIAFPGGTGTAHMVQTCRRLGMKIITVSS